MRIVAFAVLSFVSLAGPAWARPWDNAIRGEIRMRVQVDGRDDRSFERISRERPEVTRPAAGHERADWSAGRDTRIPMGALPFKADVRHRISMMAETQTTEDARVAGERVAAGHQQVQRAVRPNNGLPEHLGPLHAPPMPFKQNIAVKMAMGALPSADSPDTRVNKGITLASNNAAPKGTAAAPRERPLSPKERETLAKKYGIRIAHPQSTDNADDKSQ